MHKLEKKECTRTRRLGKVESINGNIVGVNISSVSACAACHAKGMCSSADKKDKLIMVPNYGVDYKIGELVNVSIEESLGLKAVLIAYIFPVFIMLVALLLLTNIGINHMIAGITSLVGLLMYYILLYLLRDKLNKEFTFLIEKTE